MATYMQRKTIIEKVAENSRMKTKKTNKQNKKKKIYEKVPNSFPKLLNNC